MPVTLLLLLLLGLMITKKVMDNRVPVRVRKNDDLPRRRMR